MSKGSRRENELGGMFGDRGFVWIRTAGSGSAQRELPDITAGKGGKFVVMEVKGWADQDYEYVSKREVEDLIYFAEEFGAEYYVAARFNRKNWQFLKKDEMKPTDKSYRIENIKNDQILRTIDEVCQELTKN
jgi:Holliday junction resolvase